MAAPATCRYDFVQSQHQLDLESVPSSLPPRSRPGVVVVSEDIMAVPKRKTTQGRRNKRRSHHALGVPGISVDNSTKSVHRSHHVDLKTGFYRGKQILFREEEETVEEQSED